MNETELEHYEKQFEIPFRSMLESFFQGCIEIHKKAMRESIAAHNKSNPDREPLPETFHDEKWKLTIGPRYAKVIRGTSVHCFVDMTTGNVLKASSYLKPAKGSRGNILDLKNGLGRMRQYGPEYNR